MNLEDKTNLELQIMCDKAGLSNKGGKLDMIARLKKHKPEGKPKKPRKKKEE